jgi:hypothetical protein
MSSSPSSMLLVAPTAERPDELYEIRMRFFASPQK